MRNIMTTTHTIDKGKMKLERELGDAVCSNSFQNGRNKAIQEIQNMIKIKNELLKATPEMQEKYKELEKRFSRNGRGGLQKLTPEEHEEFLRLERIRKNGWIYSSGFGEK